MGSSRNRSCQFPSKYSWAVPKPIEQQPQAYIKLQSNNFYDLALGQSSRWHWDAIEILVLRSLASLCGNLLSWTRSIANTGIDFSITEF